MGSSSSKQKKKGYHLMNNVEGCYYSDALHNKEHSVDNNNDHKKMNAHIMKKTDVEIKGLIQDSDSISQSKKNVIANDSTEKISKNSVFDISHISDQDSDTDWSDDDESAEYSHQSSNEVQDILHVECKPSKLQPATVVFVVSPQKKSSQNHNNNKASGSNPSNNSFHLSSSSNHSNNNFNDKPNNNDENKNPGQHSNNPNDDNKNQNNFKPFCNKPEHQKIDDLLHEIQALKQALKEQIQKYENDCTPAEVTSQKDIIKRNIKINKRLIKKTLLENVVERFNNPETYMNCCSDIYANEIFTIHQNGQIGFVDYNIYCKNTNRQLFVECERNDGSFKQTTNLYTAAQLQQQYNIHPKNVHISPDFIPQVPEMARMVELLENKGTRNELFKSKSVKWTNRKMIPISQRDKPRKASFIIMAMTQQEFIRLLTTFSDNIAVQNIDVELKQEEKKEEIKQCNNIDLVPIINCDGKTKRIEYCWIVSIEDDEQHKFNIAISIQLTNNGTKLKPIGIHLSIYDKHKLIRVPHRTDQCKICCHQFDYLPNIMQIAKMKGNGVMNKIQQLEANCKGKRTVIKHLTKQLNEVGKQNEIWSNTVTTLSLQKGK
eukprot:523730_1